MSRTHARALPRATILASWASDEGDGRLDLILATPVGRARWFIRSSLGAYLAIGLITGVVAFGIAAGVASTGDDVLAPAVGTAVLALYGMAIAGIGLAVGGLVKSSYASVVVVTLVVGTLLLDIIVPALRLPDEMRQLALTAHFRRADPPESVLLSHSVPIGA
jgi:ABC-type transport system involved in multi-copper enzyme maturation permease subunit